MALNSNCVLDVMLRVQKDRYKFIKRLTKSNLNVMNGKEKRLTYIDTVAGIFISYMIFMHCCQLSGMDNACRFLSIVFSCFMALFFFKSGMFHKAGGTIRDEFTRTFNKLWRPYVLFWCIGFGVSAVKYYFHGDTNWIHYVLTPFKGTLLVSGSNGGALPMWFLVTLLLVRSLSPFVLKICDGKGWVICGIIGTVLCFINGRYGRGFIHPYYISNFFPAMFFYGLGFYMKERQFNKVVFTIAVVVYAVSFIWPSNLDFQANSATRGNALSWLIYATAGIVVFNCVSKSISHAVMPFTAIGRDSMWWFLAHWPILIISTLFYVNVCEISGGGILLAADFITVIILLTLLRPIINRTIIRYWI